MAEQDSLPFTDEEQIELARPKSVTPRPSNDEEELGVPGVLPTSGWMEWVGNGSGGASDGGLVAQNFSTIPVDRLVEMRRSDGQARALLRVLTLPIRAAWREAEFVAPDYLEEGKNADEEVLFANRMFTLPPQMGGMEIPFGHVLRQILLAVLEGFSAFEEVRYVPKKGPLKGKLVLKKIAHRASESVRFRVDDNGNYMGFYQVAQKPDGQPVHVWIPPEKGFYYAVQEEENPFYGVSYFEAAHWHHTVKQRLYYISQVAAQFGAVPGRIGKLPASTKPREREAFKKALADFAFNTAMTVPHGYEVAPFNGVTGFDFVKLIDHHNMQMAKSVLATFMEKESRQVLIDNASRDEASDLLVMAIEAIMDEIAEAITHYLLPKYIDWNFKNGAYPVFKFPPLSDASRDVLKDLLTTVATAQSSQLTPEMIREMEKKMTLRLGLDVDYDAVDKREEEEKAKAEEQMAAFQQGGGAPGEEEAPEGESGEEESEEQEEVRPEFQSPDGMGGFQQFSATGVTISLDEIMAEMNRIAERDRLG